MQKLQIISLAFCFLLLSCTGVQAENFEPTVIHSRENGRYYRWGEDVIIAATYPYAWSNRAIDQFEGMSFPIYMGYLSFDDRGEDKMIYFTSSNNVTNTIVLESLCDGINSNRYILSGNRIVFMDARNFDEAFLSTLQRLFIYEVVRLPIGTAQNYDFTFEEQTEFTLKDAEYKFNEGMLFKPGLDWGISEDNLIITPKQ